MKKLTSILLSAVMMINLLTVPVKADNVIIYEDKDIMNVTKGLVYEHNQVFTEAGWVDLHVLTMDLNEEDLAFEFLRSSEEFGLRETMTGFAQGYEGQGQVVAGVNGSFFNTANSTSDSIGLSYDEGYVSAQNNYNTVDHGASTLMQTYSGDMMLGYLGISLTLENEQGRQLYIEGINRLKGDGPVIYNSLFSEDSTAIDELGSFYKLRVIEDTVVTISSPSELAKMPGIDEGYIIAIPESISEFHLTEFQPGTIINLTIDSTIDTQDLKYAISGGGTILENGVIVEKGMVIEPNARHPRTAIGLSEDGNHLVAMVVDGRGESIGATHNEMGQYLLRYGVTDAIHMDGGGSSTLIGRQLGYQEVNVLNDPSDSRQRTLLNGIGFVSLAQTGPIDTIKVIPSTDKVFNHNPVTFEIVGFDENYNPVAIDSRKVVWSVDGLTGTWGVNSFTPNSGGIGKINCIYNGLTTSVSIESIVDPIDLEVTPKILRLDYSDVGYFKVTGLDNSGYEGRIHDEEITYTISDPAIGAFINGEFFSGTKAGIAKIKIQVGDRFTTAYVAVGSEEQTIEDFESITYHGRSYPEELVGDVTVDTDDFVDTEKSYQINYSFESSADSQAYYMMIDDFYLDQPTDLIKLNVLGNNSGHMLKAKVIDSKGLTKTITFSRNINFDGWKELSASLDDDLSYPVRLERIYVVSMMLEEAFTGSINIDKLVAQKAISIDHLKFDDEGFIDDELRVKVQPTNTKEVKVFGPTAYRNRLLDNILLDKVYETMNSAELGIYAGKTDISRDKAIGNHMAWNNEYSEFSYEGVKFIQLATGSGGLRAEDYTQFDKIDESLKTSSENTIVFIGSRNPIKNFKDDREGELVHSILAEYKRKTGKTIVYINGGGYETDVSIKDGVRYIDLSGLWYTISNRYVDLNKSFYSLSLYVYKGELSYSFKPLFPIVEVIDN